MKAAWIALQRWNNQRVVRCHTCGKKRRVRRPLAFYIAATHADEGHRVSIRRG